MMVPSLLVSLARTWATALPQGPGQLSQLREHSGHYHEEDSDAKQLAERWCHDCPLLGGFCIVSSPQTQSTVLREIRSR